MNEWTNYYNTDIDILITIIIIKKNKLKKCQLQKNILKSCLLCLLLYTHPIILLQISGVYLSVNVIVGIYTYVYIHSRYVIVKTWLKARFAMYGNITRTIVVAILFKPRRTVLRKNSIQIYWTSKSFSANNEKLAKPKSTKKN